MSVTGFRLASLTLEIIERRRQTLDSAFRDALKKIERKVPSDVKEGYSYALLALEHFPKADLLLKRERLEKTPLRRKNAFRVAFALLKSRQCSKDDLSTLRGGLLSKRLWNLLSERNLEWTDHAIEKLPLHHKFAVEYVSPPWLVEKLLELMGREETLKLLNAMKKQPTWIRINTIKFDEAYVLNALKKNNIMVRMCSNIPFMYEVVRGREKLSKHPLFARGGFIIEDKGSAIVVHSLDPHSYETILDAAAAPGIKTSHIAQLAGARIIAADLSYKRIKEMIKIFSRLGINNVDIIRIDSSFPPFKKKFDKILLDAPCTNTGSLGSDPGLRLALWKKPFIEKYSILQKKLLAVLLTYVKKGGELIYATCSLLPEEGEEVIAPFVEKVKLEPPPFGSPGYSRYVFSEKVRRLFPHRDRTIGFFIAKIVY